MINYQSIKRAKLCNDPYQWALFEEIFDKKDQSQLTTGYPQDGFIPMSRNYGHDKIYRINMKHILRIHDHQPLNIESYNHAWQELIRELMSPTYKKTIEEFAQLSLANHKLELVFWAYGPKCWISPHTDQAKKTLTHMLYFNEDWDTSWGGCLRILKDNNINSLVAEIKPLVTNSILLLQSHDSWHAVTPVKNQQGIVRKALQVVFWKDDPDVVKEGRIVGIPNG